MIELWQEKLKYQRMQQEMILLKKLITEEEQRIAREKLGNLGRTPKSILVYLQDYNDEYAAYRSTFERVFSLTRQECGLALSVLKKLGFVEYVKGLMTDDGDLAGSGYIITAEGIKYLEEKS